MIFNFFTSMKVHFDPEKPVPVFLGRNIVGRVVSVEEVREHQYITTELADIEAVRRAVVMGHDAQMPVFQVFFPSLEWINNGFEFNL